MDLNPRKLSDVKIGMYVQIEDLKNGELVEGKVTYIISQSDPPEGILVKINDKNKDHVKKLFIQQSKKEMINK